MEPNKKLGAVLIITVSALFALFDPVESECVPLVNSYVARSLLPVFPQSNTGSPSPTPSPDILAPSPEIVAPSPEITAPKASPPAVPTSRKESPGAAPAGSNSPTKPPAKSPSQSKPMAPSPNEPLISPGKILNLSQQLLPPEFKNICEKTDFPALCESSIQPLVKGEIKIDPESVLLLAIQASIEATKKALITAGEVADAADCKELYDDAVMNLEDAVNAVKSRDPDTVNSDLSAALTDYSTCNDGFEETGEPNPLADVGDNLMKMASNCLAIATLVK
ncbi:PREDICTED: putative pectinesterase/pectinesterase inhibitor 26 [Tarenaya hassleriana]|uniref:putative pectinesterase/pectinesterase inhibitor 26 n=1 Tax=Tarenaya hassleriana TaxID=28532 RepID=UPI00053C0C12|nr:PREDICTED: putative pectinesterase/pectinesterase inhibitor 26 [Tarenaya hassleriana]